MSVVCRAVLEVTAPLFPPDQTDRLKEIVFHYLPQGGVGGEASGEGGGGEEVELVRAVEDEMKERHLQIQQEVTDKVSTSTPTPYSDTCYIVQSPDCATPSQFGSVQLHYPTGSQRQWNKHMLPHSVSCLQTHGEAPH